MTEGAKSLIDTMLDRLKTIANTETVVGEPVTVGDMTILPVIKISIGFVAGGGEGGPDAKKNRGVGSGGGGGASVSPIGFITYDGKTIKFMGVSKGKIDTLIETVPDLIKKVSRSLKKETKNQGGRRRGKKNPDTDDEY